MLIKCKLMSGTSMKIFSNTKFISKLLNCFVQEKTKPIQLGKFTTLKVINKQHHKAELMQPKLTPIICLMNFINKKLEIQKTKPIQYSTFKTDITKVALVFSIYNFFINKIHQANNWCTKKYLHVTLLYSVLHVVIYAHL